MEKEDDGEGEGGFVNALYSFIEQKLLLADLLRICCLIVENSVACTFSGIVLDI